MRVPNFRVDATTTASDIAAGPVFSADSATKSQAAAIEARMPTLE
jgi:hypothetical protein